MNWQFLNTGTDRGHRNMECDIQLAQDVALGRRCSTVRVYGWNPPAISLGWNQAAEEINLESAAKEGIDVVRRPTGGRAILHDDECTYSVIMPADGRSIGAVYQEIGEALVCGLQLLGIEATVEKSQPHFPSVYSTPSAAACFTSSARHEIKVSGRKLVGSAQRRFLYDGTEVVLQHGSILLGPGHRRIVNFLHISDEQRRVALLNELAEKTTEVWTILGSIVPFNDVAEALRQGFERSWMIEFEHSSLQSQTLVAQ